MIEEARFKQEEFDRYLKKITIGNKSEKQQQQQKKKKSWLMLASFLLEETMLSNM